MKAVSKILSKAWYSLKALCDPSMEGDPYRLITDKTESRMKTDKTPSFGIRRRFVIR